MIIDRARIEAEEMILQHRVWVYEVMGEITSICAIGRDSPKVAAIIKVYTTAAWRRNGFAEHLLRHVTRRCTSLTYLHVATFSLTTMIFRLFASGKESVVLNVAYDSGALRIYDKVGFVGLLEQEKPDGVEDMLELGFVGADRGHW